MGAGVGCSAGLGGCVCGVRAGMLRWGSSCCGRLVGSGRSSSTPVGREGHRGAEGHLVCSLRREVFFRDLDG